MPYPLLPADGNGEVEVSRGGSILPAQPAGQCPYLVQNVVLSRETREDLRIATAIRYGLF